MKFEVRDTGEYKYCVCPNCEGELVLVTYGHHCLYCHSVFLDKDKENV